MRREREREGERREELERTHIGLPQSNRVKCIHGDFYLRLFGGGGAVTEVYRFERDERAYTCAKTHLSDSRVFGERERGIAPFINACTVEKNC